MRCTWNGRHELPLRGRKLNTNVSHGKAPPNGTYVSHEDKVRTRLCPCPTPSRPCPHPCFCLCLCCRFSLLPPPPLAASSSAAASPRRGLWLIAAICWPPAGLCIRAHIGGVDAEALPHGGPAAAGDDPHRSAEQGGPADHSTGVSVRRERWLDLSRQRLLNNIHTSCTRTAPPLTRLTVVAVRSRHSLNSP